MNDDPVIPVDFGKDAREHARRLKALLGKVAERDDDILANPAKYYAAAIDEIIRLRDLLESVKTVAWPPYKPMFALDLRQPPAISCTPTILVLQEDYDCLRQVRELLQDQP